MLKLHCINVAEGDAELIEYFGPDRTVRILVDTGKSVIPEDADSVHLKAAEYLKKNGIDYLDIVIITHLHVDHSAGLTDVIEVAKVGHLYSSYYPKDKTLRVIEHPDAEKHVRSLERDLNTFARNLQTMEREGTVFHHCMSGETVLEADDISVNILTAAESAVQVQNMIFDEMFENAPLSEQLRRWASEARNPNSLRVDILCAGKRILIEGDYLGLYTEKERLRPCDILKIAHHGDAKLAVLEAARMQPGSHAVISCQRGHNTEKDRPSKKVADLYRGKGSSVYYTDSFEEPGRTAIKREALVFTVTDDGKISAPEAN